MGKQNIILTREDLENVKNNPNGDYVLGATIDLSGAEWSPLPWFGGTLDGNGYSITGMTVTSGQSVGLFQGLYGGYVHDLLIVDASVTVPSLPDFTNAGLLGGSLNNGSRVENVTVIGDISVTPGNGKAFVGGFTGYIGDAAMTNCFAMTTINVSTANGANVGGIAGGTGTCSLVHCDADLSITVKQSESNSSATYFVYGNTYVSSTDAADCAVRGSIFVQTLDGVCNVYGISGVSDGKNHASISVLTENGTANAFGSIDGLNCMNDGVVLATATGSGNATAVGVNGQGACINEGAVSAYSASGAASATGIQSAGDHARNSAGVRSETKTGSANATGIYAPGAANCKNACSVTAKAEKGSTYAVGLSSCTDSENSGSVSVSVQTGSAVVQGISQCSDSVNNANVTASYEGTASGSLSCQGLNNCTGSVNYGSTTGVVNGSTTACLPPPPRGWRSGRPRCGASSPSSRSRWRRRP